MLFTRRRVLGIAAAATAAGLATLYGRGGHAATTKWRGTALGAQARIVLEGDGAGAEETISEVVKEIERLENQFSLYRPDSAIARLNRDGKVDRPDPDFLALMAISENVHRASGGAFDPTIQPLWAHYAQAQFEDEPSSKGIAETGWQLVRYDGEQISFGSRGMAITLNGIAQGYIADRIALLLREAGLKHALVDMGELRAVGARSNGAGWPVRVRGYPGSGKAILLQAGRALAVSHSKGTTFDPSGRLGHILDPHSGKPLEKARLVVVEASSAAIADGVSTAICAGNRVRNATVLASFDDIRLIADTQIT